MLHATTIDVTGRSETELRVLFGMATQAVARAQPGGRERHMALTNLENVSRALRRKFAVPAP